MPHMPLKPDGPRSIPQAFPYQGSKRALAPTILSLFPDGGVGTLIEPFAGSAALSVAARAHGLARHLVISDLNAPLAGLLHAIVEQPDAVSDSYRHRWQEQLPDPRAYYLAARTEFNRTQEPALLLYLLARCVKAAVRYGGDGRFNQAADHRRLGARPVVMAARLTAASELLAGADVTTAGYEVPLTEADPSDLVYLDPPYQGTSNAGDRRYVRGLSRDRLAATLATAVDRGVSFIVSYDAADGRYGAALPDELGLLHRHVTAGVSSQATLHGRRRLTTESLYLSPALVRRLGGPAAVDDRLRTAPRSRTVTGRNVQVISAG